MLLRRRLGSTSCGGSGAGASLAVLRIALRYSSSSNDKNHNSSNGSSRGGERPPTTPATTAFQGWKRFDLPKDATAAGSTTTTTTAASAPPEAPPTTPSSLSLLGQKSDAEAAQRRAASARLADMFVESGRHTQWMQEQNAQQTHHQHYDAARASVQRVEARPHDADGAGDGVAGDGAAPPQVAAAAVTKPVRSAMSSARAYTYDEDEDGIPSSSLVQQSPAATSIEALEHELLDDNFFYYPPPPSPLAQDGETTLRDELPTPAAQAQRYVPGQQIIPPGFTRYRVDVQYQGSDFDGWYKSVQRTRNATHTTKGDSGLAEGTSRHYARTVLEEALAVALDVATVSVTAAVIPETGVSVRRLCCHVDIPSEVELQPRTILQRATLWLHQRKQPLALLCCHPCKNQDFHARHSGVRRVYCYRILNRIAPPLFDAGLQWHVDRYLDVPRMQRMAAIMEGTHDYGYFADPKMANALRRAAANTGGGGGQVVSSAYSAEHEPLTSHGLPTGQAPAAPKVAFSRGLTQLERAAALPTFNELGQRVVTYQAKPREYFKAQTNLPTVRTIDKIDVVRQEDEVLIWFVGQSFLRHQIRNMVSVLKAGGHGLWDDQELQHAFQSGFEVSRKKFQRERLPPAPVHGLTLWDVDYPAQHTSDFVPYVDAGPYEPYDVSAQH